MKRVAASALVVLLFARTARSDQPASPDDLAAIKDAADQGKCSKVLSYAHRPESALRKAALDESCRVVAACTPAPVEKVARDLLTTDEDPTVRASAASYLACVNAADAVPALVQRLAGEQDPDAREALYVALGNLGGADAQGAITDAIKKGPCEDMDGVTQAARKLKVAISADDGLAILKRGGYICSPTNGDNALADYMGDALSPTSLAQFLSNDLDLAQSNPAWMIQSTALVAQEMPHLKDPALRAPLLARVDVAGRYTLARQKLLQESTKWTPPEVVGLFKSLATDNDKTAAYTAWHFAATVKDPPEVADAVQKTALQLFPSERRWDFRRQAAEQMKAFDPGIGNALEVAAAQDAAQAAMKAWKKGSGKVDDVTGAIAALGAFPGPDALQVALGECTEAGDDPAI